MRLKVDIRTPVVLALGVFGLLSSACGVGGGSAKPVDAPRAVPDALHPPNATPAGPQSVTVGYTATSSETDEGKKLEDWYTSKLGPTATTHPPGNVSYLIPPTGLLYFREYLGRYSGVIEVGAEKTPRFTTRAQVPVTVTLEDPGGTITRVPGDFPIHPDMSDATVPQLNQSYVPTKPLDLGSGALQWEQAATASYKHKLGSRLTCSTSPTPYGATTLGFNEFGGLRGLISVDFLSLSNRNRQPNPVLGNLYPSQFGVTLNLAGDGGRTEDYVFSTATC